MTGYAEVRSHVRTETPRKHSRYSIQLQVRRNSIAALYPFRYSASFASSLMPESSTPTSVGSTRIVRAETQGWFRYA